MKNRFIPAILMTLSLSGCFSPMDEETDDISSSGKTTLQVKTRASQGEITYPVLILAYDDNGDLRGQQTLHSEAEDVNLQLNEGIYHITAVSGQQLFAAPKNYDKKTASIAIPTSGYASAPLMMGGADVMLGKGNASVSLILSYRVASVGLSLSDVPTDVSAVSVGVSQQYSAIDMGGSLLGGSTANVQCVKSSDKWQSEVFYVFPGTGSSTTLTISLTSPSGQVSYGYELNEALQAAVPYTIEGSYVESTAPHITGVLTMEGWKENRALTFDFGSGISGGAGGTSVSVPTMKVDALPEACSVWNGHIVALTDNVTDQSADLLLLALTEFTNIHSPRAQDYEQEMATTAAIYAEDALRDWSVPTEAQARALRASYAGNYESLNALLSGQGGELLAEYTSGNNNSRFLCEQGNKTFNWAKNGSITTAGTSVKYRLRLVKTVHVELK